MAGDREKALEAGCDDYDTKPVELPRLLEQDRGAARGRAAREHRPRRPAPPRPAHALNHIVGYAEMLLEELEAYELPDLAAGLASLGRTPASCWGT